MFVTSGSRALRRRVSVVNAPLALNFGTLTTNPGEPTPGMALSIYGTWNNAAVNFDAPLFMSVTNTASGTDSYLVDVTVNSGPPFFRVTKTGSITFRGTFPDPVTADILVLSAVDQNALLIGRNGVQQAAIAIGNITSINLPGLSIGSNGLMGFCQANHCEGGNGLPDTAFSRNTTGIMMLTQANAAAGACTLQVYNTIDVRSTPPTNFERGVIDWTTTTNVLTIGTQKGGTGSNRDLNFTSASANFGFSTGGSNFAIAIQVIDANTLLFGNGSGFYLRNSSVDSFPLQISASKALGFVGGGSVGSPVVGMSTPAAKVIQINDGTAVNNANGWLNWGGQQRVTSDFSRSNSTTATAITGISSILVTQGSTNNRTYKFEAWLATAGSTAGGISIAITCSSSTIAALSVDGFILDNNVVRGQQGVVTSTGTPVVNSSAITSSTPTVRLQGLIRGVSSGTFGLSLAQSTANATAVIVSSGSWLEVFDIQ